MYGSRGGGQGSGPPLKNHKNIGFSRNTPWSRPPKNIKLPNQLSMLGHYRHARETPFKLRFRWRAEDCPLMVVFGSFLPSSTKKKPPKTPSKLDPLWQNFLDPRMMALRPKTFVFQATCNFKIDSQGH